MRKTCGDETSGCLESGVEGFGFLSVENVNSLRIVKEGSGMVKNISIFRF